MTPEGFVVMLVVAGTEGDAACSQAIAYTESLARLNLQIIASCEGARGRSPAHSPEALKELLIDSVWDANPGEPHHLKRDAMTLLDYCAQLTPGVTVSKLLIFTSAERVAQPEHGAALHQLAGWLSNQGIAPIFCLTAPQTLFTHERRERLPRLLNLLVAPESARSTGVSAEAYNTFLSSCLHKQWEVHV